LPPPCRIHCVDDTGRIDHAVDTTSRFLAAHRSYGKNGFAEFEHATLPPSFPMMGIDSQFYRYVM
jgi:hypothetical protein